MLTLSLKNRSPKKRRKRKANLLYIALLISDRGRRDEKVGEKMNSLYSEIGLRLKQIRNDLKMSQMAFSRMLDTPPSTYSRLERGILPLHPIQMKILYQKFKVSADWLVTGEGKKSVSERSDEKIKNSFTESEKEKDVLELEDFLRICPSFIKELKLKLKQYYKEKKESLDKALNKEGIAFLKRFPRKKRNETTP